MGDPLLESGALSLHHFMQFCPQLVLKSGLGTQFQILQPIILRRSAYRGASLSGIETHCHGEAAAASLQHS